MSSWFTGCFSGKRAQITGNAQKNTAATANSAKPAALPTRNPQGQPVHAQKSAQPANIKPANRNEKLMSPILRFV
jgi:hypothetical protein